MTGLTSGGSTRLSLVLPLLLSLLSASAKVEFLILLTSNDCLNCEQYPTHLQETLEQNDIENYRFLLDGTKSLESYVVEKYSLKSDWTSSKREFQKYFTGIGKSRFVLVSDGKIVYDETLSVALDESKNWLVKYWDLVKPEIEEIRRYQWKDKDLTKFVNAKPYIFNDKIMLHNPTFYRFTTLSSKTFESTDVLGKWSRSLNFTKPILANSIKAIEVFDDQLFVLCSSVEAPRDSLILIVSDTLLNITRFTFIPVEFYNGDVRYRLGLSSALGDVFSVMSDSLLMIKIYNPDVLPATPDSFSRYDYFPNAIVLNYQETDKIKYRFSQGELPKERLVSNRGYFNHNVVYEAAGNPLYLFTDGDIRLNSSCENDYNCIVQGYLKIDSSTDMLLIAKQRKKETQFVLNWNYRYQNKIKKRPNQSILLVDRKTFYTLEYHYLRKKVVLREYKIRY